MKKWEKTEIITDNNTKKEAVAPVIISASRSTDIPAFYAKWFINRIKKGYSVWVNPFNQAPQYISYKNTRVIVFWTKNPLPLIPYLDELDEKNINYYFQYTLNDYEAEQFEPNVPPLERRIETFKKLSDKIGKERVVWRFDPLIMTKNLTIDKLIEKISGVGEKIQGYTEKLVFSFADINEYRKVTNNMKNLHYKTFDKNSMHETAQKIARLKEKLQLSEIATCCEEEGFDKYGINHNRCIDDRLMGKVFGDDNKLMAFLGHDYSQASLFNNNDKSENKLKDKGQRESCGCIISKDIGSYNTCNHLCIYCYANTSNKVVSKNIHNHDPEADSIIPFYDKHE